MAKKPKITDEDAELLGPEVVQPIEENPAPEEPAAAAAPAAEENPAPPVEEPAAPVTESDGVLDAHLRRQADWDKDAKEIFRGPTEDEQRRAKLLTDLSKHDTEWAKERKKEAEKQAEADKAARVAELDAAIALNQSAIDKAKAEIDALTKG